jgi:alkylation response protein AidB-like acyl-CoA dehydrogenase
MGIEGEDGTRQQMAGIYAEISAVKTLVREAAELRDQKKPIRALASCIKLLGSDLAMRTSSEAITWMGWEGATSMLELERYFRDAKALQIVEGTNQIQRLVLSREIDEMLKS